MKLKVLNVIALALVVPALGFPQGFRNQQQPKGRRFESQQNRFDGREQQNAGFEQQSNDDNQQFDNQQPFTNQPFNSNTNDAFQRNDSPRPNFRPQPNENFRPQTNDNFRRESTTFIPIIRFDKEQTIDGSYKTSWETGNNIIAEETGVLKQFGGENQDAVVQQGSFSYTSPEGTLITVQYTADEQGFRASGDHLPTPPPIPEEIQKSLEIIYAGIKQQEQQQQREGRNQQFQSSGNSNSQQFQSSSNNNNQQFPFQPPPQQSQQQQQQQQQQTQFQDSSFQNDGSGSADFIKPQQNNNINFRNGGGANRRADLRQSPRGFRQ